MLKIMGSILVFAAAAGMAGTYKRELADHLALLYALRKLLVDLSCYGNGTRQPVEVLLGCFVRTPDERLNEICRKIADCLIEKNEKNGELVWKRVFEEYRKKLCLTGEESALIGEAGRRVFGRSEEENHRRLTLILETAMTGSKPCGRAWRKAEDLCDCQYGDGGNARHSSDLDGRKAKQKGKKYDEREFDF